MALALLSCEQVVVDPVPVTMVRVVPQTATLRVGEDVELQVELLDDTGNGLGGREVVWSSGNDAVVSVSPFGLALAVGTGSTTVTATVEGRAGQASLTVQPEGALALGPPSVEFSTSPGTDPPPADVTVSSPGSGAVARLTVSVNYGGGPTGWLEAALAATATPTRLTLQPRVADMPPGSYSATVRVSSPDASNSPVALPISLDVRATPAPAPPADLTLLEAAASLIRIGWIDQSADETRFEVERRPADQSGPFTRIATTPPDAESYEDSGLDPDAAFQYRVRACSAEACSAYTTGLEAATTPAAPSELVATAASSRRIDVQWTDNSTTETSYRIERSTGEGPFAEVAVAGADATTLADVNTEGSTRYTYRVRACNGGGCSDYSTAATTTTPADAAPDAPSDLVVTLNADASSAALTWADNSTDEAEFRIGRSVDGSSFSPLATVGADVTTYTDQPLTVDHEYGYRVEACGTGGCSGFTSTAAVATLPVPPSSPSAVVAGPTTVGLSWTDRSRTETAFRIQRRSGSAPFARIGEVAEGTTEYLDDAAGPGIAYDYRVLACNDAGCSTGPALTSVATPLMDPTGVTATPVTATSIELTWVDASANESEFRIQRTDTDGAFAQIGTVAADSTAFTDTELEPGTTYVYRVQACNAVSCSAGSAEASATTGGAPAPPSTLTATTTSDGAIRLDWTDKSGGEAEFRIERAEAGGAFAVLVTVPADETTYLDDSVAPDTPYRYRVAACSGGACSAASVPATATTPPRPASGLVAQAVSATAIQLAWTDSSDTETGFRIRRRTGTAAFTDVGTTTRNTTVYTDTGLTPTTTYDYRVSACNDGGCADPSSVATATTRDTPPDMPAGLTATVAAGRVDLAWADASDNEATFEIERAVGGGAFAPLATVAAGVTVYSDTSVSLDTAYRYRVRSCNPDGCSAFTPAATTLTPPLAPSGASAETISDTRIDLGWTDRSTSESRFEVERRTGGGSFTAVGTTGRDSTRFADAGLTPSTGYGYRVRACNASGCSAYSAETIATTSATPVPAAPTGLVATLAADQSSVVLEWTDNATNESEYHVEKSTDGGTFQQVKLGPNATTYVDAAIGPDHQYTYRVEACGDAGCSGLSAEVTVLTTPLPPSNPVARYAAGVIDLSWTDDVNVEQEFRIERAEDGGSFVQVSVEPAGATRYSDGSLTDDTRYAYRIRACNDAGCSAFSATAADTTPPVPPSGFQATPASANAIDLRWSDRSATETGFRIERRTGANAFAEVATTAPGVESYKDTGLARGTTYEYRLSACNTSGCSDFTPPASATTRGSS